MNLGNPFTDSQFEGTHSQTTERINCNKIMIGRRFCLAIVKRGIQCRVNKVSRNALFPVIFSPRLHSILPFVQYNTSGEMASHF